MYKTRKQFQNNIYRYQSTHISFRKVYSTHGLEPDRPVSQNISIVFIIKFDYKYNCRMASTYTYIVPILNIFKF